MSKGNSAVGLGLMRVMVGVVFVAHGLQKLLVYHYPGVVGSFQKMGIPAPGVSAALAIAAELIGGLMLVTGFYTRLAAIPVAFTMFVAIGQVHLHNGFFAQGGGFEYPLTLLVANVAFMISGGGAFALDNLRTTRTLQAMPPVRSKAA
ncbi:DoxX [Candidatus Koribacter versatilis Ellin345]|uniref:DoxX n=1 Tax=Koribacter versatilis (strain Ellin345) TaxID=204669 RepID=Q1IME6_KORVE|nr:DoxX family protein [Candidatus Koribacter versatilis]ABF41954.1 DoxX [Candidatus Koribacter versatilis Ellin345]